MIVHRSLLALGLVFALAAPASAQEVVRLRNGRTLCGTLVFEGDAKSGFTLKRWDTGGSVFILWSQLPDSEASRIRNRGAGASDAGGGDLIDAVRILTSNRELVGIVTATEADTVTLKTRDGVQKVPKGSILEQSAVKARETDLYTTDEMIARRAKDVPATDYAKLVEVGNYAAGLRAYSTAKEWYKKAEAVADAAKKGEIGFLLENLEFKIREESAEKALAGVWRLASELKYDEALAEANKFLADYAETETGKANQQLLANLEAKKKDFQANRDKILGETVPEHWRNMRAVLLSEYSQIKEQTKAEEACKKLDDAIAAKVSEKLKCTPDEVFRHWGARTEKKMRTVSLRDGTWIFKGGQDGGVDFSGDPDAGKKEGGDMEDFKKRYPPKSPGQPPAKPVQYGLKLETRQEWWDGTSSGLRKEWLEAVYAMNSSHVKREPPEGEETDCRGCRGAGKIKVSRQGKSFEAICHECHDVKKVLTVKYW